MDDLSLLLAIAEEKDVYTSIRTSTSVLAKKTGLSQQSISLALRNLEKKRFISRDAKNSGTVIQLTHEGIDFLESIKQRLMSVTKKSTSITGRVFTGLGQGKFYTRVAKYRRQFVSKLNIDPYPGTLNIKINESEMARFLAGKKARKIHGFSDKKRTYGNLRAYLVRISGYRAAIVLPERTTHKKTLELISTQDLRKTMELVDNNEVTIKW